MRVNNSDCISLEETNENIITMTKDEEKNKVYIEIPKLCSRESKETVYITKDDSVAAKNLICFYNSIVIEILSGKLRTNVYYSYDYYDMDYEKLIMIGNANRVIILRNTETVLKITAVNIRMGFEQNKMVVEKNEAPILYNNLIDLINNLKNTKQKQLIKKNSI